MTIAVDIDILRPAEIDRRWAIPVAEVLVFRCGVCGVNRDLIVVWINGPALGPTCLAGFIHVIWIVAGRALVGVRRYREPVEADGVVHPIAIDIGSPWSCCCCGEDAIPWICVVVQDNGPAGQSQFA